MTTVPLPKGQTVCLFTLSDIHYSPKCASPYHQWNLPGEFGLHILIIPGDLFDLHVEDNKAEWTSAPPSQTNQIQWVVQQVHQWQDGELMLMHKSQCDGVHLAATVC